MDKRFGYYTLQMMTAGCVELFYDAQRHLMRGSWFWPCHPGPYIRFHEHPRGRPWNHRYIACSGERAAQWATGGLWPAGPQPVEAGRVRALAHRFDELLEHALRPGKWSRLRAINLLEGILLEMAERRGSDASPQPGWLEPALSRLMDLENPVDYAKLAADSGMSLSCFQRRFTAAMGQPPHRYRLEWRLATARRLLGDSNEPIKRIAGQLGYRDVFYFTRQFSAAVGVSPAAYRRSRQT